MSLGSQAFVANAVASGRKGDAAIVPPSSNGWFMGAGWYMDAIERLVSVVQDLSQARTLDAVAAIVRDAARNLTGADGASFVLRDGNQCYYVDENAIAPLWKGQRFPLNACVSGWAMNHAEPVVIEDIYKDSRVPQDAYRPTFVKSMAMVPIRRQSPIGAIGNYWAVQRRPTQEELAVLQALADTTSVALENVELYNDLQHKIDVLQKQQLRINEQREALDIFTRALAHDLKEPVRAIKSFTEILREEELSPEKYEEYFNFIQNAANRMDDLVQSVFMYAQLDDPTLPQRQEQDLKNLTAAARENLTQLIKGSGAAITEDHLPSLTVSAPQLIQVFQNLIANAIQYGDLNTAIHIRAEEKPDHWLFSVHDNGPGIPPEYLEKMFLPFKRLVKTQSNMGLGLATCRKVIELHGGGIWCESVLGQGSTFYFTLPKSSKVENKP